ATAAPTSLPPLGDRTPEATREPTESTAAPTPGGGAMSDAVLPLRVEPESCGDPRYLAPETVPPMPAWSRPVLEPDAALEALIRDVLGGATGSASVVVVDLEGDRMAEVNGDRRWYAASLYKLFVLFEAEWQFQSGLLDPLAPVEISCWY